MKLKIYDSVEISMGLDLHSLLKGDLSYCAEYYRDTSQRKVREEYQKSVCLRKNKKGEFFYLIGHLDRIKKLCKSKGIHLDISGDIFKTKVGTPELPGITFRDDQSVLISKALKKQRGVIKAPTGSGKTILILGIMSAFQGKQLMLVHTLDIVRQTAKDAEKWGFKNIQVFGGGEKEKLTGDFVFATIQTFSKLDPKEYMDYFDVCLVDECHRCASFKGQYYKVLTQILAPTKIGFTATLPTTPESEFALEGLIGPMLGELSINDAGDLNILAKPRIRIIKVPENKALKSIKKYNDAYDEGIVNNKVRNTIIVDLVKKLIEEKKTCLIFVVKIEHGTVIRKAARQRGVNIPFVRGSMTKEERDEVKNGLNDGSIPCAIATVVWQEGINIPGLDAVINASGGKSEVAVLQKIGRGLRRTKGKTEVIIYDFFDNSIGFFVAHFGERFALYCDAGWVD